MMTTKGHQYFGVRIECTPAGKILAMPMVVENLNFTVPFLTHGSFSKAKARV